MSVVSNLQQNSKTFVTPIRIPVGLLFIPTTFLLFFAIGEVLSGDISGLSHLVQAAPIVALILLALKKPFAAGLILLTLGLVLGLLYATCTPFSAPTIFIVEVILFLPLLISGLLLILSHHPK